MIIVYHADVEKTFSDMWVHKAFMCMPEDRVQKAAAMKQEAARKLSLAAGLLLEFGLRQHGLTYRDITIKQGEHGKPYIAEGGAPYFSISHSGTMAVCAIADTEVGVDVEQVRDKEVRESLIRKVCTDDERDFLQKTALPSQRAELFYKLWTVKESVMKQCGLGLAMEPRTIEAQKAFEQDSFSCRGMTVRCHREQAYFISVCSGGQDEPVVFRNVCLDELV